LVAQSFLNASCSIAIAIVQQCNTSEQRFNAVVELICFGCASIESIEKSRDIEHFRSVFEKVLIDNFSSVEWAGAIRHAPILVRQATKNCVDRRFGDLHVNLVHIDRHTRFLNHAQRQFAAKVLPEVFKTNEQVVALGSSVWPLQETQLSKKGFNPVGGTNGCQAHCFTHTEVNQHACRNGFPVRNCPVALRFEFMGRPMAKVQRPSEFHFEWITAIGNVAKVELGRFHKHAFHAIKIAVGQCLGMCFDGVK
jgi:hypothetical protein